VQSADRGANFLVPHSCERYVPQALIPQKPTAEWTRIVHEEAEKIRGFELNESGLVNLFLKKGVYTCSRPVVITSVCPSLAACCVDLSCSAKAVALRQVAVPSAYGHDRHRHS
jgi:hypothetical protein